MWIAFFKEHAMLTHPLANQGFVAAVVAAPELLRPSDQSWDRWLWWHLGARVKIKMSGMKCQES